MQVNKSEQNQQYTILNLEQMERLKLFGDRLSDLHKKGNKISLEGLRELETLVVEINSLRRTYSDKVIQHLIRGDSFSA